MWGVPYGSLAQNAPLLTESFDAATPPQVPSGWQTVDAAWITDGGSSSPGSGGNNLRNNGTATGTIETPIWDFQSVAAATVSFLARRTSTYEANTLSLTASIDGGSTYPFVVLAPGTALPEAASTYTEISADVPSALLGQAQVRFRFEAGGQTGGNARIDDFTLSGAGSIPQNTFGFQDTQRAFLEGTTPISVPLVLDFIDPNGLQGLEFSVEADADLVSWLGVEPGPDLQPVSDWTLSHHIEGQTLTVVLLHAGTSGLKPGRYTPLLSLQAAVAPLSGNTSETVILSLRNVTGALSKRTGDDATLRADPAQQTWTIERGAPVFFPSDTTLDFGAVPVGETQILTFDVSNPGGTTDLLISEITTSNPLFSISPTAAQVAPDDVQTFRLAVTPEAGDIGTQNGTFAFTHNAADGPTFTLPVTVRVLPTAPGDANQDGAVDIVDLMLGVDFVLGRTLPSDVQVLAVDVHPYATGNGTLDIRDLTVLVQAISRGEWPDGEPLPSGRLQAAKGTRGDVVQATWQVSDEALQINLSHTVPLRALHLVFSAQDLTDAGQIFPEPAALEGMSILTAYQAHTGALSVLMYRLDGEVLEPGTRPLAQLVTSASYEEITFVHAQAVDATGQAIAVNTEWEATEPVPQSSTLNAPYPHPFGPTQQTLTIPLEMEDADEVEVGVFDTLGRRVNRVHQGLLEPGHHRLYWDGRTANGQRVTPGLYVVRLATPSQTRHRTIVVQ